MTPESIALEIRNFIIENFLFGETADPLRDDDSFLDNGILDSTGVLQLVAFLEERFKIVVADEELSNASAGKVSSTKGKGNE